MSKKILTDELIIKKLEAEGYLGYYDMDENKVWDLVEKHYDCEVTDEWHNSSYDFYCYTETTADGYEVFIATYDCDRICISDDVHYYDSDLSDEIEQAIYDGNRMYVDDLDSHYFKQAVENAYYNMYNDKKQEIENELIEEGYEYKTVGA